MDTEKLLEIGARGIHLLFANDEIEAAFEQDADSLRNDHVGRSTEVNAAIDALLRLDDVTQGRRLIDHLDDEIRHVLVLIYFDLLDTHVRQGATLH